MIKEFCQKLMYKYAPPIEPPYEEKFFSGLNELEFPKYLKLIYKIATGNKLNLKNPKTFREKIQWLKLYGATPLKTKLTDKVLVRDWVKEKIGEEYLKPVFQVCDDFSQIDFSSLPQSFMIKVNHGCNWQFKIKNKDAFLKNKIVYNHIRDKFEFWLKESFWYWSAFEMQYKGIQPKIIIEPLFSSLDVQNESIEYEIFCFNGKPQIYQVVSYSSFIETAVFDEEFYPSNICFDRNIGKLFYEPDEQLKNAVELSKKLCEEFPFVKVGWTKFENKLYFNELVFTPASGLMNLDDRDDEALGRMLVNYR